MHVLALCMYHTGVDTHNVWPNFWPQICPVGESWL